MLQSLSRRLPLPRVSVRLLDMTTLETGPPICLGAARSLAWTRLRLAIDGLTTPAFRFVHLSDLHLRSHISPALRQVTDRIAADPPDAVLMTGDFVDDKLDHAAALPALEALLPRLRGRLGTYGILGNHDGDLLAGHLSRLGVVDVSERMITVRDEAGQARFQLLGLPGVTRTEPTAAFENDGDRSLPTVALSHYPDNILRLGRVRPHVTLAGHTHGGQICLPGGTAIIRHDDLPRPMYAGCHPVEDGVLIVSRGVGTTKLHLRFFAPPEVIEVWIEPA